MRTSNKRLTNSVRQILYQGVAMRRTGWLRKAMAILLLAVDIKETNHCQWRIYSCKLKAWVTIYKDGKP